jgi:hypothetical protein
VLIYKYNLQLKLTSFAQPQGKCMLLLNQNSRQFCKSFLGLHL